jgi:hypothetical protein
MCGQRMAFYFHRVKVMMPRVAINHEIPNGDTSRVASKKAARQESASSAKLCQARRRRSRPMRYAEFTTS